VEHRQGAPCARRLSGRRDRPEADRRRGGKIVGKVTSGGFAPTRGRAIAMGYLERAHSANGTKVGLIVRGKPVPAEIVPMPFVKHTYYRG